MTHNDYNQEQLEKGLAEHRAKYGDGDGHNHPNTPLDVAEIELLEPLNQEELAALLDAAEEDFKAHRTGGEVRLKRLAAWWKLGTSTNVLRLFHTLAKESTANKQLQAEIATLREKYEKTYSKFHHALKDTEGELEQNSRGWAQEAELRKQAEDELAALRAQLPRWIPVSERLPGVPCGGRSADVLVYLEGGYVFIEHYYNARQTNLSCWSRCNRNNILRDITHWQPISSAPAEVLAQMEREGETNTHA